MKRYGKRILTVLTGILIASAVNVNAKMMSVEELGKAAEGYESEAGFIFVVGKYAYTSNYEGFNIQDVMLASRSIDGEVINPDNVKDLVNTMTIYRIDREYDGNYQATGWSYGGTEVGNGTAFGDENAKVDIKYIDYHVIAEDTTAEVSLDIDNPENSVYKDGLKQHLNFDTENFYGKDENKISIVDGNKVKGILLKKSVKDIYFNEADQKTYADAEYFLAAIVKVPGANEHTTITTTNLKGVSKTATWSDFDVQTGTPGMFVLFSFNKKDWENSNKQITIIVDMDGTGREYNASPYTLDLREVEFQEESKPNVSLSEPTAADKQVLDSWNYDSQINRDLKLEDGKLTGVLVEQKLTEAAFGASNTDGFYFDFKFTTPDGVSKDQIQIESLNGKEGSVKKKYSGFDEENNLTILYRFPDDTKKCEVGNTENCKLYFRIDYDGDGDKYFPTIYEIDYSQVEFEKNSKFSVTKELPSSAETTIKETFQKWGFKPEETFEEDFQTYKDGFNIETIDQHNVKISGLLPLMKLTSKDGFGEDAQNNNGYYFFYVIKTDVSKNDQNGVIVTVPQNREGMNPTKVLKQDSFDTEHEMAILMQLDPNEPAEKQFKVIVDMDGEGTEYAPYEIIFDYSEVDFQLETISSISLDESDVPETDKALLDSWNYQFPNDIKLSEENSTHKKGELKLEDNKLTGTIKEQKLTGGGFEDESDSYFFTYTIEPNEVKDTIEVTVTDIAGETSYDINDFAENSEGKQVLTILHHISKENVSKEDKTITITIDADGKEDKHYTEETYEIDYKDVDFVDLHEVKINDNSGKTTETIPVYDGEKLVEPTTPAVPKHEVDINQYNTFDHWEEQTGDSADANSDTEFTFTEGKSTEEITEDVTLYPIWEIDVNQYITDAITEINKKPNVQEKFELEKVEDYNLKLEIIDRNTKIEDISDTAIASALAHAIASGEIKAIELEFADSSDKKTKFENNANKDEQTLKTEFATQLKEFLEKEAKKNGESTLNNLYTEWQKETDKELKITIDPVQTVAKIKDKEDGASVIYHVTAEEEVAISFNAGSLDNPDTQYVKTGDDVNSLPEPDISAEEKEYRTFDGWFKNDNEKVTSLSDVREDTTLTAHYKLNTEKFVEDVIKDLNSTDTSHSNGFSNSFVLSSTENEITIELKKPNVSLSTLGETSIPGAIAYVLEKNEIKDISLSIDGETQQFKNDKGDSESLKDQVIKDAKTTFNNALVKLESSEVEATLDELEFETKTFTIKIGEVVDTVKLVDNSGAEISDDTNKTYTFKFDSDFAVVNADSKLGADNIKEALESGNNYSTIYVDSDITETAPITIDKDITIKSVENSEGISLAADTQNTITVNNQDTVIDVQGGNVTLKDLKITGGKKSELKVESGSIVTVEDIDVSGNIEIPTESKDSDEMHANILVEGQLTVNGTITNDNESYKTPTIALVTHWAYPGNVTGEDDEKDPNANKNIHPNASVDANGLTHNYRYHIIKPEDKTGIDSTVETYYGDFYYVKKENSEIYYMAINDSEQDSNPFYKIKVYYHGDNIDFKTLGYESGVSPTAKNGNDKVFDSFTLNGVKIENTSLENATPNSLGFKANNTNLLVANYKQKPSMSVNLQSSSGLTASGNKISGLIETKTDGEYVIPITLTSEKFQDGKTKVEITNPNGETETKTYSANTENGIAPTSVTQEMKLNLEAIKSTKITGDNGKIYTLSLDLDGSGENEETYTIDYSGVETIVEKINNAAKNTQEAESLTITRDNNVKGNEEKSTYQYDKTKDAALYTSDDNKITQYSFRLRKVDTSHVGPIIITVNKNAENDACGDRPCLNVGWVFANFFTDYSKGSHEISLLQDMIKTSKTTEAILEVESTNEAHTYNVKLNNERVNAWLNDAYLDGTNTESNNIQAEEQAQVVVKVKLNEDDSQVVSMETESNFAIKNVSQTYNDNHINVTFSTDSVSVGDPLTYLAKDGETLTVEQIKTFYEQCKAYHKATGGGEIYEG